MNNTKIAELEKLARPLVEFLQKNYHPHCQIVIDNERVRVVEDAVSTPVYKAENEKTPPAATEAVKDITIIYTLDGKELAKCMSENINHFLQNSTHRQPFE